MIYIKTLYIAIFIDWWIFSNCSLRDAISKIPVTVICIDLKRKINSKERFLTNIDNTQDERNQSVLMQYV